MIVRYFEVKPYMLLRIFSRIRAGPRYPPGGQTRRIGRARSTEIDRPWSFPSGPERRMDGLSDVGRWIGEDLDPLIRRGLPVCLRRLGLDRRSRGGFVPYLLAVGYHGGVCGEFPDRRRAILVGQALQPDVRSDGRTSVGLSSLTRIGSGSLVGAGSCRRSGRWDRTRSAAGTASYRRSNGVRLECRTDFYNPKCCPGIDKGRSPLGQGSVA
jgi:hypothetical protein